MALNLSLAQFSSWAAAGADLSTSIPGTLTTQWRSFRSNRRQRAFNRLARASSTSTMVAGMRQESYIPATEENYKERPLERTTLVALPEFLRSLPRSISDIGLSRAPKVFENELQHWPAAGQSLATSLYRHPLSLLITCAQASGRPVTKYGSIRPLSTSSATIARYAQSRPKMFDTLSSSRRQFSMSTRDYASPQSYNQLAHAERTANNNPTSASSQNAFYTTLLKAGHPDIVRERYQTGRYAANEASTAMYLKALEALGKAPTSGGPGNSLSVSQANGITNPQLLQAVGQAVAAGQGGATTVNGADASANGSAAAPLHVTVSESWGTLVLRWTKFIVWTIASAYLIFMLLGVYVEMSGAAGGGIRSRTGRSSAEVHASKQTVRFSDVHGCDQAKDELQELVEFLKNPDRFSNLGGKLPKGVLLVGPPGTGKTLLAKAVAGEAGCAFFYMSGSEFDEMYVGVGARRVRELFNQARAKSPAIIFIDELDAVGGKRSERDPSYAKQTLNQLLTELDGFSSSTGIILIGATNFPQSLDKALTRPGRFDRRVVVPLPDVRGRIEILKHHMKNVHISTDVDATIIARGTSGFSGADLENLVNQAAVRASRLKHNKVGPQEFDWAKDKIVMGAENRTMVIQPKDKLCTAYHEAGHALVNLFTPGSPPLYKMTIIPRGMSLGATHFLPEMDIVSKSFDQYLADIDVSMGGYAAEELIYGSEKITSGASSDISKATEVAQQMVTRMGYSRKLGNVDLASHYDSLSAQTKSLIESEVRSIIDAGHSRAMKILTEKRKELELLKDALMEYETLTKEELDKVLRGEKLEKLTVLEEPISAASAIPKKSTVPTTVLPTPPASPASSNSGGGEGSDSGNKEKEDKKPKSPLTPSSSSGGGGGGGGGIKLPEFVLGGSGGKQDKK